MSGPPARLRSRILPSVLTAAGVTVLAAGLLTYTLPVDAEPARTTAPSPSSVGAVPTPSPLITLPPLGTRPPATPSPTPAATPDPDRVATRIRIEALDIDLPVIRGPDGYPPCDVAMYLKELAQPGQGRAVYIYAHARPGMFEPLLRTKAREQRGSIVEVWTSDEQVFRYEIVEVRRAQTTLEDALAATSEELWLQTSEGPAGTIGKTQVIARPVSSGPADDPADAHPEARPLAC